MAKQKKQKQGLSNYDKKLLHAFVAGCLKGDCLRELLHPGSMGLAFNDYLDGYNSENIAEVCKIVERAIPVIVDIRNQVEMQNAQQAVKH